MNGDVLRLLRVFNDYSSKEMADKLKISQSYVSELETGKKKPTLDIIEKYAEVFDMKPSTIMLFAESLENEDVELDKKQRVAKAGMKLLRIIEKVGKLQND